MGDIIDVTDSKHEGRVKLPRVLIVETPSPTLSSMMDASDTIRKKFHCEPVFAVYNPNLLPMARGHQTSVDRHDFTIIDNIADFAKDPEHHIDMVVTGRSTAGETYGLSLSKLLKKTTEPFKGPVALQAAVHDDIAEALSVGAIGTYDKSHFLTQETSAVKALMDAHTQSRGQGIG